MIHSGGLLSIIDSRLIDARTNAALMA